MEKIYKLELNKKDLDIVIAGLGKLLSEVSFQTLCVIQDQLKKQGNNQAQNKEQQEESKKEG